MHHRIPHPILRQQTSYTQYTESVTQHFSSWYDVAIRRQVYIASFALLRRGDMREPSSSLVLEFFNRRGCSRRLGLKNDADTVVRIHDSRGTRIMMAGVPATQRFNSLERVLIRFTNLKQTHTRYKMTFKTMLKSSEISLVGTGIRDTLKKLTLFLLERFSLSFLLLTRYRALLSRNLLPAYSIRLEMRSLTSDGVRSMKSTV